MLTEYITTFSFSIIDDCPEFYSVILESTKSKYPEKNSYLELLLSEIQDCFKANGGKSYSELKVLVDDKMAELLIKNRVLVGELYEDGIAGMDVINDSIYYLIHHSKDYLKTVLFMGIDMLVDAYLD